MHDALDSLTEKEKETLRLIVRGHDAKSAASELDLSVHTINERLRAARRKLDTTSSREAARILFESEGDAPENLVYEPLGDAQTRLSFDDTPTAQPARHRAITIGVLAMLTAAIALAISLTAHPTVEHPTDDRTIAFSTSETRDLETTARNWLDLLDARDWDASYAETASSFREANTLKLWSDTASRVQGDLGVKVSREFRGVDDVPSPQGLVIAKFRTDYTNRKNVTETLSLVREDGIWKVAGIYVS